jgi:group II intron reverse transcriptase/maturase
VIPNTEAETDTFFKLSLISSRAERDKKAKFTSLAHLLNKPFLLDCYNSLNKNKAVGIDNVSHEEYGRNLDTNLEELVCRLKSKKYKPIPSKRVYIPKDKNEKRPLGISAIENKIVELGITRILETIYEEDFLDISYGFRPKRNCHQAISKIDSLIRNKGVNHIVEADIKGFFDNVSHDELMNFLNERIVDTSFLSLIRKFLKAGYVDKSLLVNTEKGTPQGSILSPMLANIFLHYVLDIWFEGIVKKHVRGYCELIRYADDFICLVQYEGDAVRIERALKNRLGKYGLTIHPEKSRRFSFGRFEEQNAKRQKRKPNTFNFLGFTHFCTTTLKGKFKVGHKTNRKKFVKACKEMNQWLKAIRNACNIKEWWKILKAKLSGHYNYYGISGNYRSLANYFHTTKRLVYKWLNRRSQKKSMNWQELNNYLKCYPLPKPEIKMNIYTLSDAL